MILTYIYGFQIILGLHNLYVVLVFLGLWFLGFYYLIIYLHTPYTNSSYYWHGTCLLLCFGRILARPSSVISLLNPRDVGPQDVFAFLAKCSSIFTKCVAFPMKRPSPLVASFLALFEEVTIGASRWSATLYIARLSTMDPLCFVLVCYLPHSSL